MVDGKCACVKVDTGADLTLVKEEMVPSSRWLQDSVVVSGWKSSPIVCNQARVKLTLGPWSEEQVVALAPTGTLGNNDVLLSLVIGSPAFVQVTEWAMKPQTPEAPEAAPVSQEVNVVTRAQRAQRQLEADEQRAEELQTAIIPRNPSAVAHAPEQETTVAEVEGEGGADREGVVEAEGETKRQVVVDDVIDSKAVGDGSAKFEEKWDELVLPMVSHGCEGKRAFITQTKEDPSLAAWRGKADSCLEGFPLGRRSTTGCQLRRVRWVSFSSGDTRRVQAAGVAPVA